MQYISSLKRSLLAVLLAGSVSYVSAASMDMGEDLPEFHPINAGSKAFHWITTLFLLLIIPSISTSLAFANRLHWSLLLQCVSTAYSVIESIFLDFPDNVDNHENRTSKGTSWFLSILLGVTIFMGTLINGSNLVINKFYPHLARKHNEYGLSYKVYKSLSLLCTITGWVRVCLAPIALFGFCYGKHTGQCLAHGIMGSAFVLYSFVLSVVLVIPWIRKHQLGKNSNTVGLRSQEFYDSTVMMLWGIVNTFTEHRWGKEPWNMGDYQHTSMGIIWWGGGLLGMFLSRNNKRTFVPALLLIFTGWSMSEHVQFLEISTKVHAVFGIALMGAGLTRIIEISFVLKDESCSSPSGNISSFQYIPPFCLTLSGILFMGANEEQLQMVHDLGSDHSAYILTASSGAFLTFLWILLCLWFYLKLVGYDEEGEIVTHSYTSLGANDFELGDLSADETALENDDELEETAQVTETI
ncbi:hypothetical protein KGF56_000053 [Candida oxycetoniae]|uniref:Protein YTP1-like C-terminal domain-containing protein n=1 Tax=Candida oxycetoniae TaxID=497107 RepID=A0AAI9X067_9ASCO|nr:uncharacterized protein KGF56_000053 [Candida oxycetoniae]KAI3407151.2 hypothetical protein KGF56_000053 [Candida oxycetoniae]